MADSSSTPPTSLSDSDSVVVAGLGRFGAALATELSAAGVDVLGIDKDEDTVQSLAGVLTHVVRADTTRQDVLEQLDIPEFTHAVVAIGTDLEASILTTSWLMKFKIPSVWAKALTAAHGQILGQLGVHHVIYPETEMGKRVAHLLRGSINDYQDIGGGFAMVTAPVPPSMVGKTLAEIALRSKHELNIVAVHGPGSEWEHATEETVLAWDDTVIVMGPSERAEHFVDLA